MEITRSLVNFSYVNTGNLADGKPADILQLRLIQ
jgi:hypothetical protein